MEREVLSQYISRFEAVTFVVSRSSNALIRDLIDAELTLDQYSTLRYIAQRGACTSSELSEMFCVNKSATTAIIARLVDKSYIERLTDPKDRRIILLSLTEKGNAIFAEAEERIHSLLSPLLGQFRQEEIDNFILSYEKLARIIQEGESNR